MQEPGTTLQKSPEGKYDPAGSLYSPEVISVIGSMTRRPFSRHQRKRSELRFRTMMPGLQRLPWRLSKTGTFSARSNALRPGELISGFTRLIPRSSCATRSIVKNLSVLIICCVGMARGFQRVDISRSVRNPLSAFDAN